jgi:hypothetical protein
MTNRLTLGLAGLAAVLLLVSAISSPFPAASQLPSPADGPLSHSVEAAGEKGGLL